MATTFETTTPAAPKALPSFPDGGFPPPEPAGRKLFIRAFTLLAIAVSLVYLAWRAGFTIDLGVWWISVPFFALEAHAVFSLGLFAFSLWDIDVLRPARPVRSTAARIAVLIPTYNESREVLLPTIAAALALRPAHETWVLDDGDRPAIEELARELGARYLTRPEHHHAKAGNLNHALQHIDADFVAVLDADHVARPDFLTNTLGYFDDPKVAVVQTPQEFYNLGSFEHESVDPPERPEKKHIYHEQELFYRLIQTGKNRWGAAFWCGTNAVVRVSALREIGGIATETITEDIHTSVRLHRRGWKIVYHNETLARGLAAQTAAEYQLQRQRWGTGAMQLLRLENPLIVTGLRLRQRIAYAATLLGWFESWRSLGYLLVPAAVLFTGAVPIRAQPVVFLIAFGLTFTLQQVALRLLSRGHQRLFLSVVFDLVRMTPNLLATFSLILPVRPRFRVTPKGRLDDKRRRVHAPALLVAIAVLSVAAAVWFDLTVSGLTPTRYEVPWAAYGASFWLTVNMLFVLGAISRTRSPRFAAERRGSVRFAATLPGELDGVPCTIHDLSLGGALVSVGLPEALRYRTDSRTHVLTVKLAAGSDGAGLHLKAIVRSHRAVEGSGAVCGLQFLEGQEREEARLALALFNAQIVPDIVPAPPHEPRRSRTTAPAH